jgi:hypothetical protein
VRARARERERKSECVTDVLCVCVCVYVCAVTHTHTVKFIQSLNLKPYSFHPSPPLSSPPTVSEADDSRSRLGFRG